MVLLQSVATRFTWNTTLNSSDGDPGKQGGTTRVWKRRVNSFIAEAMKAFEGAGAARGKDWHEILSTWREFTLAVSGNTIYVGKRDGHLVASFDMGNNWLDLTPALPFPVKAFKDIVFAEPTVYVATDAGVAASSDGKQWHAITDAAGTRLNMEKLTVDRDTLYGFTKNTGIYRLEAALGNRLSQRYLIAELSSLP